MVLEIIIGIIAFLLILGLFGFSMVLAFVIMPLLEKLALERDYPTAVPGWGMRLSSPPPFNATLEDVARGLQMFLDQAVKVKNYDRATLRNKINNLRVAFIRAQNEDGKRYIVDQWGRKIAGDHSGDNIRVVVLDDDTLARTAFFHEIGHEAHEMENKVDYDHEDKEMWNDIVGWCKKNF